MQVFGYESRQQYLEVQIARSASKFRLCKVSMADVAKYAHLLRGLPEYRGTQPHFGPILCLGTRSGREIDLFRIQFFGPTPLRHAVRALEYIGPAAFQTRLPRLEAIGRSDVDRLSPRSVVGVEINPQAARSDVWIGSFDEMPEAWDRTFGVVYSNSFDHAQDPERTLAEWKRVLRPGGYLILCYATDQQPKVTDPVGQLLVEEVIALLGGRLVYFHEAGSRNRYAEVIVQL